MTEETVTLTRSNLKYLNIKKNPLEETPEELCLEKHEVHHRLTDFVRDQYMKYTIKVLNENYQSWLHSEIGLTAGGLTITEDQINETAMKLEAEALQACMVVSLYRKAILKIIQNVQSETKEQLLNADLIHTKFNGKKAVKDVGVQTETHDGFEKSPRRKKSNKRQSRMSDLNVSSTSLDEKIRKFQESFNVDEESPIEIPKKPKNKQVSRQSKDFYTIPGLNWNTIMSPPNPIPTPTRPPATPTIRNIEHIPIHFAPQTPDSHASFTPHHSTQIPATPTCLLTPASTCTNISLSHEAQDDVDAKIMQELQAMFGEEETDPVAEIFDEGFNPELERVMHEIESYDDTNRISKNQSNDVISNLKSVSNADETKTTPISVFESTNKETDTERLEYEKKERLKQSVWPCELHHQKMRLRSVLSQIADCNFRKYEKIKQRFRELFDDDTDDVENELGPYSPSIELDDILIASCRKRIANWTVKALMRPLKEGLIANRYLFKKVAKHVAESIIFIDQYPDERFVKEFINDYFCKHNSINSIEDVY